MINLLLSIRYDLWYTTEIVVPSTRQDTVLNEHVRGFYRQI